jgi:hypothetical protein
MFFSLVTSNKLVLPYSLNATKRRLSTSLQQVKLSLVVLKPGPPVRPVRAKVRPHVPINCIRRRDKGGGGGGVCVCPSNYSPSRCQVLMRARFGLYLTSPRLISSVMRLVSDDGHRRSHVTRLVFFSLRRPTIIFDDCGERVTRALFSK